MLANSPHFAHIKQRLVHYDVLSSLRAAVLDGTLAAGDHIVETEIAARLGISRGPVREALAELEQEGLVVKYPYRGTFVASFSAHDVREIYSLRALLEGRAARLAATRVQPEDVDRLQAVNDAMQEAGDAGLLHTLVEQDIEFHRQICQLSGHALLLRTWSQLVSRVRLFLTLADQVYFAPEYIVGTHRPTVAALRKGDPDLAQKSIEEPIIEVGETVARHMEPSQPST